MAFLLNRRKVRAAAASMHQFCSAVRAVLPDESDDQTVESVTLFVYLRLTRDVFGRRFANAVWRAVRPRLKYVSPLDARSRVGNIVRRAQRLKRLATGRKAQCEFVDDFNAHVQSVVRAILSEAGLNDSKDFDTLKSSFDAFERAVRSIHAHLTGIKQQPAYLMRS